MNNELQRLQEAETRPNLMHLPAGPDENHLKPKDGTILCLEPGPFEYEAEAATTRTLNAETSRVH